MRWNDDKKEYGAKMKQFPLFYNMAGEPVMLLGEGAAADAKRRLIERAGGVPVGENDHAARVAFVALEKRTEAEAAAERLKARGLLVNVVDRPDLCDFTTPAIVDRNPVTIAIGTGGASAGLAKALRIRLEAILPEKLGALAAGLFRAREAITQRWPRSDERRRALDVAMGEGGAIDPFASASANNIANWLSSGDANVSKGLFIFTLSSDMADDLTLLQARLMGQADYLLYDETISPDILNRARADAERIMMGDNGQEQAENLANQQPDALILYFKKS